jgi:serine protease Do
MKILSLPLLIAPILLSGSVLITDSVQDKEEVNLDLEGAKLLEQRIQAVYENVSPAVVGVLILNGRGDQRGEGSGIIIDEDGLVLTVGHNLQEGGPGTPIALVLSDGTQVTGKTLGRNDTWDFGLIQIDEDGPFPFAEMAPKDDLAQHEVVLTIGHPNGMRAGRPPVLRVGSTAERGTISRRRVRWVQHTGKIMPGDSGGGVFDLEGRIVGVNSWINAEALENFATSMQQLRAQFDQLAAGKVVRGQRGQRSRPRGPLNEMGLRVRSENRPTGLRVLAVVDNTLAEAVGFQAGDLMFTIQVADEEPIDLEYRRDLDRFLSSAWKIEDPEDRELTFIGKRKNASTKKLEDLRINFQLKKHVVVEKDFPKIAWPDAELTFENASPSVLDTEVSLAMAQAMKSLAEPLKRTVFEVRELDKKTTAVSLAIAVEEGFLVTVASALRGPLAVRPEGGEWAIARRLAEDEATDLLLLGVDLEEVEAVTFTNASPLAPGLILGAAGVDGQVLTSGVVGTEAMRITRQPNGFLGVQTRDQDGTGARIELIVEDSAASRSELELGDVITAVNGEPTGGLNSLLSQLRRREVDEMVEFTIQRGDDEIVYDIRIGENPRTVFGGGMRHVANRTKTNRRKTDYAQAVRHDLNLLPNQVGAPVIDLDGNVVGLHVSRADRPGGFLIPSAQVVAAIHRMRASFEASLEVEGSKDSER